MEELLALRSTQGKLLILSRGQEVEGVIIKVTNKEAVLDLGTKSEGIIQGGHNLKIGDSVKAFVVDPENESGQVVLALEKTIKKTSQKSFGQKPFLTEEKWQQVRQKYKTDDIVRGVITKITQFGVFVKLEEGIEGLIHNSKLGPDDNFTVNQEVSVVIDGVDSDKKRISLAPVLTSTKGLIYK